jgi:hypothetical protein
MQIMPNDTADSEVPELTPMETAQQTEAANASN